MTTIQKTTVISTLLFLAIFFHILFCDWETGQTLGGPQRSQRQARVILPMGTDTGIHSREATTHTVDAIMGFALPIVLVSCCIFILGGHCWIDTKKRQNSDVPNKS
jgi:hypothetical protein